MNFHLKLRTTFVLPQLLFTNHLISNIKLNKNCYYENIIFYVIACHSAIIVSHW